MRKHCVLAFVLFLLNTIPALAGEGTIDTGDTAWVTMSTALVMMMTPAGLALFYGGLSRYKNLLNTMAMILVAYCLASVIWVAWGYSLAFGRATTCSSAVWTIFFFQASTSTPYPAPFPP